MQYQYKGKYHHHCAHFPDNNGAHSLTRNISILLIKKIIQKGIKTETNCPLLSRHLCVTKRITDLYIYTKKKYKVL